MSVFAMSDLHLSLSADKPMDVFGGGWSDYMDRIRTNWNEVVSPDDTVIIGGDVSWAMYLTQCKADFDYIEALNGVKIISKGNHDYWWESITKLDRFVADSGYTTIKFMHNNSYIIENYGICGTRGWLLPGSEQFKTDDRKMYDRELIRLELSAQHLISSLTDRDDVTERVAVMHYPPVDRSQQPDEGFHSIMKKYDITKCIYGHLHGRSCENALCGEVDGIKYRLVSSDYMKFLPCNLNF